MHIDQNHTFYFIKYPLGGGGVHLANLISLSDICNNFFQTESKNNYFAYLEGVYTDSYKKHVHSDQQHIISDVDKWKQRLLTLDYTIPNSVHLGHAASFDWANNVLKLLENKRYINIVFTTQNSVNLLRSRERSIFGTDTLANMFYQKELEHFYNKQFESTNNKDYHDEINFTIEFEDLCKAEIQNVIKGINEKYNLQVPLEKASYLHNLWLDKQDLND